MASTSASRRAADVLRRHSGPGLFADAALSVTTPEVSGCRT